MKHKHAELIKAWADGAVIQQRYTDRNLNYNNWEVVKNIIWHDCGCEYRIKPEPKPDEVRYAKLHFDLKFDTSLFYFLNDYKHFANLKLTFDGETGKLISAEVL